MKINTDEAVYIQRKDFVFLISTDLPLSTTVYLKSLDKNLTTLTEDNKYDFIKMNGKYEKNFFNNFDWLLDYEEVKQMDESEISLKIVEVQKEIDTLSNKYRFLTEIQKMNNRNILIQIKLLAYKLESLSECILYKKGLLNFDEDSLKETEKEKIIKIPTGDITFI